MVSAVTVMCSLCPWLNFSRIGILEDQPLAVSKTLGNRPGVDPKDDAAFRRQHPLRCDISTTKIAIMLAFHVAPGSADGRRGVSERDGTMTDISLQKTAKTAKRARGRPFPKGQSGNPAGRPRGSSNRATRAAEILLDSEAAALTRKAVELALAGDPAALRLCLDRTVAPRRERAVELAFP